MGLGITVLEEATPDNILALIIDPKGDMGNLMLAFPSLSPADFAPRVEEKDPVTVAKQRKERLAKWGEDGARIGRFCDHADRVIYTPVSKAGVPLSILNSFKEPPEEMRLDTAAFRDRVLSTVSSLLG